MVTSLCSRGKQIRSLAERSKGASCFGHGQLLVQKLISAAAWIKAFFYRLHYVMYCSGSLHKLCHIWSENERALYVEGTCESNQFVLVVASCHFFPSKAFSQHHARRWDLGIHIFLLVKIYSQPNVL